jgi:hypothetical protein
MNTQRAVYEKLFKADKVELASHNIELALIDDVDKAYKEAMAAREKSFEVYYTAKTACEKALKEISALKLINEKALPLYDKLDKFVKEVGVSMPPVYKDQKDNLNSGLKNGFASKIKTLQSIKF